jgi:outer membrane protein TolC
VEATKQAARRTDLHIIYDVKRMYYGAVLSGFLHRIGEEVLLRLNATLELTERLYKKGSGTVTKADYLRNKVIVESIRSAVVGLESNREISKAALLNTMGLSWDADYDILETEIPFNPYSMDLELLVSNSYVFNPDWRQLLDGLKVAKEKIKEEKGGALA